MLIEDGTGSGRTGRITVENRVAVDSISIPMAHHVNQYHGLAFEMYTSQTPVGTNPSADTEVGSFIYIKNSNDLPITLLEVRVWAESAEYIDIYLNDTGSPVDTTTVTPINMNLASGNTASGTFLSGNNITGLTKGTLFDRLRIPADNNDHVRRWPSDLIIPKNNVLTFYAGNGSIPIEVSIQFYYHGKI